MHFLLLTLGLEKRRLCLSFVLLLYHGFYGKQYVRKTAPVLHCVNKPFLFPASDYCIAHHIKTPLPRMQITRANSLQTLSQQDCCRILALKSAELWMQPWTIIQAVTQHQYHANRKTGFKAFWKTPTLSLGGTFAKVKSSTISFTLLFKGRTSQPLTPWSL